MNAPFLHPANLSTQQMRLRLGNHNDVETISSYLANQPDATPFHRVEWMAAVEAATGHKAIWILAESGGALCGMLPMHGIVSPLFGRTLVSSGFAVDGGILADDPAIAHQIALAAQEYARRSGMTEIELRGGHLPRQTDGWIMRNDAHAGFICDLASDDDAQLLAIPRKQRAEVRRGLGYDLTVSTGNGDCEADVHYALYAESVRNLGTPVFPKALFDEVRRSFGDDADILTVSDKGKPLASVFSLYHRGVVMPFWGGGSHDARKMRANDVMYYALMNHARVRGCNKFDFGRSKVDSGAYHFKRNWGFEPQPLAYANWSADGSALRDINPNSPRYKAKIALWQRLPLSIANRLGPLIAKDLG